MKKTFQEKGTRHDGLKELASVVIQIFIAITGVQSRISIARAVCVAAVFSASAVCGGTAQAGFSDGERAPPPLTAVPGEVIVQFRTGTDQDRIQAILAATSTRIKKNLGAPLVYLLSITGESSVDETIGRLKGFPEVQDAEPNQVTRLEPLPVEPPSNSGKPGVRGGELPH